MFVTFLNVPVLVIGSLLGFLDFLPFTGAEAPAQPEGTAIERTVQPGATPTAVLAVATASRTEAPVVIVNVASLATASPTATARPPAPTATPTPAPPTPTATPAPPTPTATPRLFPTNREVGILRPVSTPTAVPYSGQKLGSAVPSRIARWDAAIQVAAETYRLDPNLIAALMNTESNGDPSAVSSANAVGLLQVIDGPRDPHANVLLGTKMLAHNLRLFDEDLELALAAYNAGPRNVLRYKGVPPFAETQAHIQRTMADYERFRASSGG